MSRALPATHATFPRTIDSSLVAGIMAKSRSSNWIKAGFGLWEKKPAFRLRRIPRASPKPRRAIPFRAKQACKSALESNPLPSGSPRSELETSNAPPASNRLRYFHSERAQPELGSPDSNRAVFTWSLLSSAGSIDPTTRPLAGRNVGPPILTFNRTLHPWGETRMSPST